MKPLWVCVVALLPQLARATSSDCHQMPDGTLCATGDRCTRGDFCVRGVCVAGAPVECPLADDACHTATCDPELGCVVILTCAPTDGGPSAQVLPAAPQVVPKTVPPPGPAGAPNLNLENNSPPSVPTIVTPDTAVPVAAPLGDTPSYHVRGDALTHGCQAAPAGHSHPRAIFLLLLLVLAAFRRRRAV